MKKYWWAILIILALPVVINFLLLAPAFSPIVGEDTDWLAFWGGYLGSIISAGVAFIILHIQRKDNETQNEENRDDNETQNKANRQLQLNILRYQQQSHWLDNFRIASLEYCHTFNNNDVIMAVNIMWDKPKESFEILKNLYNRMIATEAQFSFVKKHDEQTDTLVNEITKIHISYRQILDDLQWIVLYFIEIHDKDRSKEGFLQFIQKHQYIITSNMAHILTVPQPAETNNRIYFNTIFQKRAKGFELYESIVRDMIYEYIKQEQKRIDNILTENIN